MAASMGSRAKAFECGNRASPKERIAIRERQQLEQEIQSLTSDLASERKRLNSRIEVLEKAIPDAQEAARRQAVAEVQNDLDVKIEEANRLRSRLERKHQDATEEWEA